MQGRSHRRVWAVGALAAGALALGATGALPGPGATSHAAGQTGGGEPEPTLQTDASVPGRGVIMMGSSPLELPGQNETWGIGEVGPQSEPSWAIARYTTSGGWAAAPAPLDHAGEPLPGFEPERNALTGEMTPGGSGVLAGKVPTSEAGSGGAREVLLVRNPGGAFQETEPVPAALLKPEEILFAPHRAPLIAALDEGDSKAGALVVPVYKGAAGIEGAVLHWNGTEWAREPIETPKPLEEGFRVLAIAASSPSNAWLLAQLSSQSPSVALFRRHVESDGSATWLPVSPAPKAAPGEPLQADGEPFTVAGTGEPPTAQAQTLTVTSEGVWIDGEREDASAQLTLFFKPEGAQGGSVLASWCNVPEGFPKCTHELPDSLPRGPYRSFAWSDPANTAGFGQRVITGLGEGVSLRLEGTSFKRVLALGGSEAPDDVGGTLGAAFSSPQEGWLGNSTLPVHLTMSPAPNQLAPFPVPFHDALAAIAPQPGAPVGALTSQALAVGDQGEVARFEPGEGWVPEALPGPGGGVEKPHLRAVAWPTAERAYAVGTEGQAPQMWLWRGETGLWEPDPATPLNFRGNLLGIAFDPNEPSRGYAVGQQGILLRYGKTWTQEANLPPQVAEASFTSIAFAGSEAIVAYRKVHTEGGAASYTGGVLVNHGPGSSWEIDQGAAQALGSDLPWAVAGLPDGGAAISATDGSGDVLILERDSATGQWHATPTYPGYEEPGSLAPFRENGALRVVASGGVPNTLAIDTEPSPPAGFPPKLIRPYPLASGYVLRQTADGWADEEHERNEARDPLGEYKSYDMVYQPDPTSAVVLNQSGTEGWAVGGFVDSVGAGLLDTADVERYPADGVAPPGAATAPVQTNPADATFAIGGNAQCRAACADRANARLGPDVWLSSALESAAKVSGVRAFLYTGPRVTTGEGHGAVPVAYSREFGRYAQLLGSSGLPAFAAASATDRPGGSECAFQEAFSEFPPSLNASLTEASRSAEISCAAGSQPDYYSLESSGAAGPVRVIVLEDATEVGAQQRTWLAAQLTEAAEAHRPAIVVGNADLNAQIAAQQPGAQAVANILAERNASAYFYDSPGHNIELPLRVNSGLTPIPTFGSGTLGYVSAVAAQSAEFTGHSGYLLAEVAVKERNTDNRAPVGAVLIPNIGELALEAKAGVLLHRSQPAPFNALARRPRAGGVSERGLNNNESYMYVPIPANCIGVACATAILPQYTFSSSRPDIGGFVEEDQAAPEPHETPLPGPTGEPIHEPVNPTTGVEESKSGLFCAYNPGTTTVTISAGGLSASLQVTVEAGSVRRPCGTVPLKEVPSQSQPVTAQPPPAPAPAPAGPAPAAAPAPLPVPPPPALPPPAAPPPAPALPAPVPPFLLVPAPASPLLAAVPPPLPTPARPSPPSGTSAVTSPVEAAQKEEEVEEAPESVSNQALAYRESEHEPSPAYLLGLIVLAAFAGASLRRRPRRGRRELHVAPATISTMRAQRQMSRRRPPY